MCATAQDSVLLLLWATRLSPGQPHPAHALQLLLAVAVVAAGKGVRQAAAKLACSDVLATSGRPLRVPATRRR